MPHLLVCTGVRRQFDGYPNPVCESVSRAQRFARPRIHNLREPSTRRRNRPLLAIQRQIPRQPRSSRPNRHARHILHRTPWRRSACRRRWRRRRRHMRLQRVFALPRHNLVRSLGQVVTRHRPSIYAPQQRPNIQHAPTTPRHVGLIVHAEALRAHRFASFSASRRIRCLGVVIPHQPKVSRPDPVVVRRQKQRSSALLHRIAMLVQVRPRNRPRPPHADVVLAVLPLAATVVVHKQVVVPIVEDDVGRLALARGRHRRAQLARSQRQPRLRIELRHPNAAVVRPIADPQGPIRRENHSRIDRVQVLVAVRTHRDPAACPLVRRVLWVEHRVGRQADRTLERPPVRNRVIQIKLPIHANNVRRPHIVPIVLRHARMHIVRNRALISVRGSARARLKHAALARPRHPVRRRVERRTPPRRKHPVLPAEPHHRRRIMHKRHPHHRYAHRRHLRPPLPSALHRTRRGSRRRSSRRTRRPR